MLMSDKGILQGKRHKPPLLRYQAGYFGGHVFKLARSPKVATTAAWHTTFALLLDFPTAITSSHGTLSLLGG